jgi:dTDP-4-dehydrorhamnose 3,5-epimerase
MMHVIETLLPEVKIIEPRVFGDERGFFLESWNAKTFSDLDFNVDFVQDNHSRSNRGVLRGLHYQLQQPQGKLVRVVTGAVFDVAVDLRRSSPNFGKCTAVVLNALNKRMLWIPPGFAHGFLCLEDGTDFLYKCSEFYAPEHERSLLWSDPALEIDWPIQGMTPQLSSKDIAGVALAAAEAYP